MPKRDTSSKSPAESHFVGILKLVVLRDSSSYDGHFHISFFQFPIDIIVCGIAFHRGTKSKDDFLHTTFFDALHETFNLQIARTDAIHRTDNAAKYVIETTVLHRVLDSHHVLNVLDYADQTGVSRRIAADFASFIIADIVADLAIMHASTHLNQTLCQCLYPFLILTKQVKSQAKSRLAAYSRQTIDFHYGFLEKL